MPTNRRKTPRKLAKPKTRHGAPVAPDRASKSERGKPFPAGNALGLATQYKPGQTGNAGGVPKDVREYRELMRQRIPTMLARLDDVLEHGTEEGVIKAIREVNVNSWPRSLEVGGPDGGPVRVTYDDVRTKLTDLAKKAEERKAAEAEEAAETEADADDDDKPDGD